MRDDEAIAKAELAYDLEAGPKVSKRTRLRAAIAAYEAEMKGFSRSTAIGATRRRSQRSETDAKP